MKPLTTYNDDKADNCTYQYIINYIPKSDTFIDVMVGNGGIFFNLNLPTLTVINDVDKSVIDRYNDASVPGIIVENKDYAGIIRKYDVVGQKIFFYFDPPYLIETRRSSKRLYNYEWNEEDHVQFLKRSLIVKSNVMVSHYPCRLYDKYLIGWNHFDFQSMTRKGLAGH